MGSKPYQEIFLAVRCTIIVVNLIRNLNNSQEYKKDDQVFVAVEGTTMDLYEGQISALLGQNGAGKTTTMNMIVGW